MLTKRCEGERKRERERDKRERGGRVRRRFAYILCVFVFLTRLLLLTFFFFFLHSIILSWLSFLLSPFSSFRWPDDQKIYDTFCKLTNILFQRRCGQLTSFLPPFGHSTCVPFSLFLSLTRPYTPSQAHTSTHAHSLFFKKKKKKNEKKGKEEQLNNLLL